MSLTNKNAIRSLALQLQKQKQIDNYLANIRALMAPEYYGFFVDEILKVSSSSKLIPALNKFTDLTSCSKLRHFAEVSTNNEIRWVKAFLLRSVHLLKNFISYSNLYALELMNGNYLSAQEMLFRIEEEYGYSIWLIKSKIAFLQLTEGLEAQKKFANEIKQRLEYKGNVAVITHWVSSRNEGSVSAARFTQQFLDSLNALPASKKAELSVYLKYHILGEESLREDEAVNIIRGDFSRSLVDVYEAFLTLCRILTTKESIVKKQVSYILPALYEKCGDDRCKILINLLNPRQKIEISNNTDSLRCYDLLLTGAFEEAYSQAKDGLLKNSNDPFLIYIAAFCKSVFLVSDIQESSKAISEDDKKKEISLPLKDIIIDNLSILFKNGIGASTAVNTLNKVALNFSDLACVGAINLAFAYENLEQIDKEKYTINLLRAKYPHPLLLKVCERSIIFDDYKDLCLNQEKSLGLTFGLMLTDEITKDINKLGIYREAMLLYESSRLLALGDYNESYQKALQLILSDKDFYQRQGQRIIAISLIKLGKIIEACNYISELYVNDVSIVSILPLLELVAILTPDSQEWKNVRNEISLSIVYDIIYHALGSEYESYRAYAYEDFLVCNGYRRPSELEFDGSERMLYFLKNICVENVMDYSIEFEGPEDVENERLEICKKLKGIDTKNELLYSNEIKDIVRNQKIRSLRAEVDKTKVYVDLVKVRQFAERDLQESYNRYQMLLKYDLNSNEKSIVNNVEEYDFHSLINMEVPTNEPFAIFRYLVREMRILYAISPEFGLDRYLSTRLRHGAIENQLRKPLSTHNLITQKESKKGLYKPNFYWMDRMKVSTLSSKEINSIFAKFSEKYDKLILEISTQWVKINTGEGTKALLMQPIVDSEVTLIQSLVTTQTTFKQFLDIVINYFDTRLEIALELLRKRINDLGKSEAKRQLNHLQSQISKGGTIGELDISINHARTEMQLSFDKVIEWFSPAESIESSTFLLEEAINVAKAIVNETFPLFSIEIIYVHEEDTLQIEKGLMSFVDIFTNAFENIVKRSGLEVPSAKVVCALEKKEEDIKLNIVIQNELGNSIIINELKSSLAKRKDLIDNGKYEDYIVKEGGSGLFKIFMSIQDLKQAGKNSGNLNFYVDANKFILEISLPFKITNDSRL